MNASPVTRGDDFDAIYGTDTAGIVRFTWARLFGRGTRYEPCDVSGLRWAISAAAFGPELTFIDIGCGKGRALIVAAMREFSRIIGVERSKKLCRIAEKNLRQLRTGIPFQVFCMDATRFAFPFGPKFVFAYHPMAPELFEIVLNNLKDAKGPVVLVYQGPGWQVCAKYFKLQAERGGMRVFA